MGLSVGDRLGRYEILAPLGAGGMGEVYRAHDTELERDVAVKVLPEAVSQNSDRLERFEKEAKAVARLSHPNILDIHDYGREGDVTYSVTELLEGETLGERLEGGALGWRKATEIGAAIADGLGAAHEAGIVHRDVKSSNVFLTSDGRVKVLDFGLARHEPPANGQGETAVPTMTRQTDPGTVLGTVGYMSPEQVRGENVDHRSDIFSLGCVLYEMVCGRRAFVGDTPADTMAAILKEPVPEVSASSSDVSPDLERIVLRCLEKSPGERFESAKDLAFALRSVLTAADRIPSGPLTARPAADEKPAIAVLPFQNLSADPEQEYFCDGVVEEITADLSQLHGLRVISRNSAMQMKGVRKDTLAIARALGVRYVLEGSVRKAGNRLRITAQLIDAPADEHLWAQKYDGTLDDVFDIQEKVSRSIVDALEITLTPDEDQGIASRPFDDFHALDCYYRARQEMLIGTAQGLERAKRNLETALEAVGEHPLLYAGLAEVYFFSCEYGYHTGREQTLQDAEGFVNKVVELDRGSGVSHYLLGRIERFRGSILKALEHFERALAVEPNHGNTLYMLSGEYSLQVGRPSLAEPLVKKLFEIDPLSTVPLFCLGINEWMKGDLDLALSAFRKASEISPEATWFYTFAMYVLAWQQKHEEAFGIVDHMARHMPDEHMTKWAMSFRYALQGEKEKALEKLSEDVKAYFWSDPEAPWFGAFTFALLDEKDESLEWLEHAVDRGWINYPLFAEKDPFLENIRGEERFRRLMNRIKPMWDRFESRIDPPVRSPGADDR